MPLNIVVREEDDEIILQCCYCIHQFLLFEPTMKILIGKTPVVEFLIDLLYDRNLEIRKACDACLALISVKIRFLISFRKLMMNGKRNLGFRSFHGITLSG